jgi:hypothetical protein
VAWAEPHCYLSLAFSFAVFLHFVRRRLADVIEKTVIAMMTQYLPEREYPSLSPINVR